MRVAVLGGGIAGVLAARTLLARGYDVHVFEAAERIGGLCRSDVVDGFAYDVAGGHVLHSRDRGVLAEMVAVLGDEALERRRETKIYYHGRYVKYPFENGLSDLPPEHNYACLQGYVDAYLARERGAPQPDNFRDWITWRFGTGMAEHFMFPYNEKIWCIDLASVSSEWCSGRVPEAPLADVLRASLGMESEGYTHQATFYYPRHGGFEALVHAFARGLEKRIRVSSPVREVVVRDHRFEVNGEPFDRIVNTLPLPCLFAALEPTPPADVREALRALRHLSLSTVLVAVGKPDLSRYSWVYLPHAQDGPMNRITYLHNYSPGNAPPGCSSVLAEVTSVGGAGPPDLAELERTVVASLERTGMVRADWVLFTRSHFNEFAYPLYDVGYRARVERVLGWLRQSDIPTIGRFARHSYVNTDQVYAMVRDAFADDFAPVR